MILQSLTQLYDRRQSSQAANEQAPASFGLKYHPIPFAIELNNDGRFIQLLDLRTNLSGKRPQPIPILIPMPKGRSGTGAWKHPNLLWDHYGFVLGHPRSDSVKDAGDARKQSESFKALVEKLCIRFPDNSAFQAVHDFLSLDQEREKVFMDSNWSDCAAIKGCNLTFRIAGASDFVCQHPDAIAYATEDARQSDEEDRTLYGACLVTGEVGPIARLHPSISGVAAKPAPLAAANTGEMPSASSFGKKQGFVFPVSEDAAFKYSTALNDLLARGSRQRVQVGDTSVVFWADAPTTLEDDFYLVFGEPVKDDPSQGVDRVKAMYESFRSGKDARPGASRTKFYVLALAPASKARIAVRFWHVDTVAKLSEKIAQHFRDIAVVHDFRDVEVLSLKRLLESCGTPGKTGIKVPPNLSSGIVRAILEGIPYPRTLLQAVVNRCRVEQAKRGKSGKPMPNVSHERAAILKASLNRLIRHRRTGEKEFTVSLDEANTNPAYRLGRLFAAFEKAQVLAAERELNKTIRDSFFGAAMTSPRSVFPRLIRLNAHHVRNLKRDPTKRGLAAWIESTIGAIGWGMDAVNAFPAILAMEDQGRFAIGYYHQRQAFYSKTDSTTAQSENPA